MTIDREQLIDLLVEKTGLEKEQVKEQLDQLIIQIQKATDQGKSFEVEGLGTFREKDDTLHFEPDDTLQTEINHKYAGMKPIELIGAYEKTSDTEVGEGEDISESVEAEPEPEPEEKKTEKAKTAKFQLDEEALAEEEDEEEDSGEPVKVEELKKEESEAVPQQKQSPVPPKEKPPAAAKKESKDPLGKFLVAAVIVIAVGVSGWMMVDFGVFDGLLSSPETTTASTMESVDENEAESNENENDLQNPAVEQNAGDDVSTSESVSESSGSSVFGLRGESAQEASEGYTIVIHSLRSEPKVRELENSYRSDGYITIVREATVDGQTYWRLGLGQFRTVEEAQQAIDELPEPERSNNFIRKFQ